MTEQTTETQASDTPATLDPSLKRAQFSLVINTYEIDNLREGVDLMSMLFGKHGLSAFFVVATDPDTGEQWVIQDGEYVIPMDEWEARAKSLDEADDPALEEAVNHIVLHQLATEEEGDA